MLENILSINSALLCHVM